MRTQKTMPFLGVADAEPEWDSMYPGWRFRVAETVLYHTALETGRSFVRLDEWLFEFMGSDDFVFRFPEYKHIPEAANVLTFRAKVWTVDAPKVDGQAGTTAETEP